MIAVDPLAIQRLYPTNQHAPDPTLNNRGIGAQNARHRNNFGVAAPGRLNCRGFRAQNARHRDNFGCGSLELGGGSLELGGGSLELGDGVARADLAGLDDDGVDAAQAQILT